MKSDGKTRRSDLHPIEEEALSKACLYADALYQSAFAPQLQLACCEEDFAAGYASGAMKRQQALEFLIKQMRQILEMSAAYGETYSCSIAKFSLEKVNGK